MNDRERDLLREDGWVIECESPLELGNVDGSFATLRAAEMVIPMLVLQSEAADREE